MRKLERLLQEVDGKSYPAYKSLRGTYQFADYLLCIEHVQGDPFASPSDLKIEVPGKNAKFPTAFFDTREKKIAFQDDLLRHFYRQAGQYSHRAKGSGKSGVISVSCPGQEILERSGCEVNVATGTVTLRLSVGFPANGRRIQSRELHKILFEYLPVCVKNTLLYDNVNKDSLREKVDLAEDQAYIKEQLRMRHLVAFVANGSVLPRKSGVSQEPMDGAVPFTSPTELEVTLSCPHAGAVKGMGVPAGITLIVGGGYHGKSTLLQALERGVYHHIPGDGREYVITESTAMKIRAEDGRAITGVDISSFINHLPNGKDTVCFTTPDASGSTSQAANVAEAIETGSRLLLIDEDTSATNFMVRDELMQRVVCREKEPIIPYVERIRELYENYSVSTILVAGSSGAYFETADTVIQMDEYKPFVITEKAKSAAKEFPGLTHQAQPMREPERQRIPKPVKTVDARGRRMKIKGMGTDGFVLNRESVELRYVEQIVDGGQSLALANMLLILGQNYFNGKRTLPECLDKLWMDIEANGWNAVMGDVRVGGNLTMPRREELYACVDRYRGLQLFK